MRDPVHGHVVLTHEEIALLDTPEMQRLRGVKQLGTAYLVHAGALHTRFDARSGASTVPRHTEIHDVLCRKICRDLGIESP